MDGQAAASDLPILTAASPGLLGFGSGFWFISVSAAYSTMPASRMGHATGFCNLIRNEASFVGIATATALSAHRIQFRLARLTPNINRYNLHYYQ